jgi:signal transduction histidine kinase
LLLIEDSRTHALLTQNTLVSQGIAEVTHVGDAEAALSALDDQVFDVLLVDHFLPGMNGLEFVKIVRARGLDVPIVMLTAQTSPEVASECMKSGANDYLCKEEGYLALLPDILAHAHAHVEAQRRNRELERQLKRKCDELEQANRRLIDYQRQIVHAQKMNAIITLVRGICHELNNPLTGILGYAQLLQEIWEGEGMDDLKEIESCAQRCREIIGKLARFCRTEKPTLSMVCVNEAVQESLQFVEYFANRHRVNLVSELASDLPSTMANLADLRQAFLAVFVNAIQAMAPKKNGILKVRSYASDGLLYVVVSDTGEGIPSENLDRIFLPFFTTREVGEGSGMGLAIAYGIVGDHEGTILVDSTPGEGSRFSFVMPIRAHAPPPAAVAAAPASP